MLDLKTCNRCGRKVDGWNKPFFEKTGKWKLVDHKTKDGDWCIRNNFVEKKYDKIKKSDFVKCELCLGNSGHCYVDDFFERHPHIAGHTLKEHKEQWHPNNEILDDYDFMSIPKEEQDKLRKAHGYTKKSNS